MTQRSLAAALLIVATSARPALRKQPAGQATQQAAAERKICRTEKATGSLTRRTRICHTAANRARPDDRFPTPKPTV